MKKFCVSFMVVLMVIMLPSRMVKADDFNWAQWYDWMGIYTILDVVCSGEMTPIEAFETIMIPAHNAGYVTEKQAEIYAATFPETEQLLLDCGALKSYVSYEVYLDMQDMLITCGYEEWCTPYAHEDLRKENTPAVPEYTIEECDIYKYATTDVNIRIEPSTNAEKIGNVPKNEQVHVIGKTSNGWYHLDYNGTIGFSVTKYYIDEPEPTTSPAPTLMPTSEPTPEPTEVPTLESAEVPTSEPAEVPTLEPTEVPIHVSAEALDVETIAIPAESTAVPEVISEEENKNAVLYIAIGVIVLGGISIVVISSILKYKKSE